jgi:CheY-like chemotaxis protein
MVMSKILLVDDDAFTIEAYRKKLLAQGFDVQTAADGLAAVKMLNQERPDLVVLDLMMPKFNGFEVLKYVRSQEGLKDLRVVVLSNFYTPDGTENGGISQADVSLLKSNCSPGMLIETINHVLGGASTPPPMPAPDSSAPPAPKVVEGEGQAKLRRDFLKSAPAALATIRQMNEAFVRSEDTECRSLRLLDFFQKVRSLKASAASAGFEQIVLLAGALEALLFELHHKPALITFSSVQTVSSALDLFRLLFADATRGRMSSPSLAKVLVVDDDPISMQALLSAMRKTNLNVTGVTDSTQALQSLTQEQYSLVLLDIEMPGLDGFEVCQKLRAMPEYRRTPILFVSGHTELDNRIHSVLSGADDLISKPIFPIELALKAIMHLLRSLLPEPWGPG